MTMWIEFIPYEESSGPLRSIYDRVSGRRGTVDNILQIHSLRPHTLSGHMALYKSVLHHTGNTQPAWFLETVGVYVSLLNGCEYCVAHHLEGLRRLVGRRRADELEAALKSRQFAQTLSNQQAAALRYAEALTVRPVQMIEEDVLAMRTEGWSDGEILEINQVVAYFAYANRTANGLGVTKEGDQLGLSPGMSDDLGDWEHE